MATVVTEAHAPGHGSAPATGKISIGKFALALAQLGLLALVLRQFQIEGGAFLRLALLAFAGFAIHAFLPVRWRLPFFLLLSLAGIVLVLGPGNAVWLVAIGLVLIGICHLPVAFPVRVTLVVCAGLVLAAQRAAWLPHLWSEAIWPILGSMFMFRLIVYLYELKHDKSPVSATRTLSYFFMLPNVCFPLFPVVDYKTFRRNYYDQDAYETYQTGIDWMLRGVVHLILYRYVYHYLTLAPSEVLGPGDLARYILSNFLLYLRVSGQFHLIVGMLYLFGFRLPETHHLYYLASSFTDFWRRINIYWKDFMLKVFYYPAFFALRRMGSTQAMVIATLFVFLMTWALHAYQWFWLRGTWLLAWQDVLFWAILGGLVVINSLWEAQRGRERSLAKPAHSWRSFSRLALSTFATFCFICILWSFWTSESVSQWLSLWSAVGAAFTADMGLFPGLILAAMLAASTGRNAAGGTGRARQPGQPRRRPPRYVVAMASLVVLQLVGMEGVHREFGSTIATVIHTLRSPRMNRLDNATMVRGYYEQLLRVDRFNSQLWEVYTKKPARWLDVEGAGLKRFVGGFAGTELIPSVVVSTSFGTISINRWGMRDQDYELAPGPGTYRIAVLGASTVMGWGAADGETFEALVENRMNREKPGGYGKYEILNFGIPGYDPPQQLPAFERALQFGPNAVFYVAAGRESARAARFLARKINERGEIPYGYLKDVLGKAGVVPGMDEATALKRIEPYIADILSWTYRHMVEQARARGIVPVLVYLPQVTEDTDQQIPQTLRAAEAAGFTVMNLGGTYKNRDLTTIRLAEWDDHPNARGHQLVAESLYQELLAKQGILFAAAKR